MRMDSENEIENFQLNKCEIQTHNKIKYLIQLKNEQKQWIFYINDEILYEKFICSVLHIKNIFSPNRKVPENEIVFEKNFIAQKMAEMDSTDPMTEDDGYFMNELCTSPRKSSDSPKIVKSQSLFELKQHSLEESSEDELDSLLENKPKTKLFVSQSLRFHDIAQDEPGKQELEEVDTNFTGLNDFEVPLDEFGLNIAPYQITHPQKSASLWKRGDKINKSWKRRIFILKNAKIYYFRSMKVCLIPIFSFPLFFYFILLLL